MTADTVCRETRNGAGVGGGVVARVGAVRTDKRIRTDTTLDQDK